MTAERQFCILPQKQQEETKTISYIDIYINIDNCEKFTISWFKSY